MENTNESTPNASPSSSQPGADQQGQKDQSASTPSQVESSGSATGQTNAPQPNTQPVTPPQTGAQPVQQNTQQQGTYQHTGTPAHQGTYGQTGAPVPPSAHAAHSGQTQGTHPYQSTPNQQYQQPYRPAHQASYDHSAQGQQAAYQSPSVAAATTSSTPEKKSGGSGKTFGVAFAGAALAVVLGLSGFGIITSMNGSDSGSSGGGTTVLGSSGSNIDASDTSDTLASAVANKVLPSVVNIDVYVAASSSNPFGFGDSSSSGELTESSLGSGVVLSEDGYILTNYHVIEGSDALEVTIGDETYEAEVVGTDPSSDLAVIKAVGASGLTAIEIGTSSDLEVGEWVMSAGSPFGLEQSVATGIVSATSRSQIMESTTGGATTIYTNLIQTDAAINPGNSGGALVDSDGKLIGINTLITSYSGNYSGVGFAIPVDYAISIAEQIINGETPTHAQLGVSLSSINSSTAQRYGLSADSGAYVSQIYSGGAAESAGIEVGDIITKFNDEKIESASDLMLAIRSVNPGDKANIEINRNGETMNLEVTLGSDAETSQSSMNSSSGYGSSMGEAA